MKYLLLFLTLTSCADIQRATNVNVLDNEASRLNTTVKTLNAETEASACTFISNATSEDNIIHAGKEASIISMKRFAQEKEGNAILVQECKEVTSPITPVHTCKGKIYKCP